VDGGDTWNYYYTASLGSSVPGPRKALTLKQVHDKAMSQIEDSAALLKGHGRHTRGIEGRGFTNEHHRLVDAIGDDDGDHSDPSIRVPGTSDNHWVPDHQPPNEIGLAIKAAGGTVNWHFYPHSLQSSRRQGSKVGKYIRLMASFRKRASHWAKGVRSSWFHA
jgi:hypothetical protein